MAFRRRFPMRRRFRRRASWETLTVLTCRSPINLLGGNPCNDPTSVATILLSHSTPFSAAPERYLTDGLTKNIILGGTKFASEHHLINTITFGDPGPENTATAVTIWEALVVLPLAQGAGIFAPLYVPNLATPVEQGFDYADRLLWKRVSYLNFIGLNLTGGGVVFSNTVQSNDHGNQVVKSRLRLDERHGLFYVRTFVHDLVLDPEVGFRIDWDFWAKLYVRRGR